MDYLTRFYKNQSEILAEKVKVLEEMLLSEASPPDRNFRKGDTSQSAWSTSELESRAGKIKKGGIFQQVDDKDQSQEWKDIQAELASRKSASTSKNTTNQTTSSSGSMPSQKTAATPNNQVAADGTPILLQRVPGQPDSGWNRPRTTPMPPNQPPHPMDLSGVKAPGTKPKPKPTQQQRSGPNSPDVEAERARLFSGMVKDTLNTAGQKDKFDTSLSLSGSSTSKPQNKTQPWDGGAQTSAMAQNLLNQMNQKAQNASSAPSAPAKTTGTTTQQSLATAANAVVANATNDNPLGPRRVQATKDPKLSTYESGGFAKEPSAKEGLGKIQLVTSPGASPGQAEQQMGDWGKRRLEAEVGHQRMSDARQKELRADYRSRNYNDSGRKITPQKDVMYKAPTTSAAAMNKFREEEQEMINRVNQQRGTNIVGTQYSAAPAIAGVDVEGPPADLKYMPTQEKESLGSQLMRGFGDMGRALFNLPSDVAKAGQNIQNRR
jgi:hypothetical protein